MGDVVSSVHLTPIDFSTRGLLELMTWWDDAPRVAAEMGVDVNAEWADALSAELNLRGVSTHTSELVGATYAWNDEFKAMAAVEGTGEWVKTPCESEAWWLDPLMGGYNETREEMAEIMRRNDVRDNPPNGTPPGRGRDY